jgi:hypothetical protein
MGSAAERRGDKGRMSKEPNGCKSIRGAELVCYSDRILPADYNHPPCTSNFFLEFVPVLLLLITTGMSSRGFGYKSEAAGVGHHLATDGDLNSPCVGDDLTGRPCITHLAFFIFWPGSGCLTVAWSAYLVGFDEFGFQRQYLERQF